MGLVSIAMRHFRDCNSFATATAIHSFPFGNVLLISDFFCPFSFFSSSPLCYHQNISHVLGSSKIVKEYVDDENDHLMDRLRLNTYHLPSSFAAKRSPFLSLKPRSQSQPFGDWTSVFWHPARCRVFSDSASRKVLLLTDCILVPL